MGTFLLSLLLLVGMFLMLVILIQRGRGGGLAGAFGGLGGQSAFGTKAGDVFTVITIVTAVIWVLLACVTGWRLRSEAAPGTYFGGDEVTADKVQTAPDEKTQDAAPVDKAPASDDGDGAAKDAEAAKNPHLDAKPAAESKPSADSKSEEKRAESAPEEKP